MLFAELTAEGVAAAAAGVSWFYWLIPVGLVLGGLIAWNWSKVKEAFTAALPEIEQVQFVPFNVDPATVEIGNLKNGFALLLELDRYSPPSLAKDERDKLILEGVARLLKARSEAGK